MSEYVCELPVDGMTSFVSGGELIPVREYIVRCKDCKHYSDHEWVLVTDVSDVCHFFGDGVKVEPDGFCKWGERKAVDG